MKKILFIEDDTFFAEMFRNKFLAQEFQVKIVGEGQAALEILEFFPPDLVLLDLMLPQMNGIEILNFIRNRPDIQRLPVIVFTNAYHNNMIQRAWKAGANKCLIKAHCSPKELLEVVRKTLEQPNPPPFLPPAPPPASEGHRSAGREFDAPQEAPPAVRPQASWPADPGPPGLVTAPPPPAGALSFPGHSQTDEIRKLFLEKTPETLAGLRQSLSSFVRAADLSALRLLLAELYQKVHLLTSNAAIAGMEPIARLSDAFGALVWELHHAPQKLGPSTFQTLVQAVDSLGILLQYMGRGSPDNWSCGKALVVDDEPISRRVVAFSLDKARIASICLDDPVIAYQLLTKDGTFDLIILDVEMPGMNGFELCVNLRKLPAYQNTPVVFVTNFNDADAWARSSMTGATDFMAKPILFFELAVKALGYVLRSRCASPAK